MDAQEVPLIRKIQTKPCASITIATIVQLCTIQLSFLNATQQKSESLYRFLRLVLFVKKAGPKPNSLAMSKFSYFNDQRKLSEQNEIKKTNTTNKWHLNENENEAISHNSTSKWWLVVSYTCIAIRRFTCLCSDPELDIINCFKTIYHAKCFAINTTECIEHKN